MKKVITTISVYEIIMILILSSTDACNGILCMFSRYRHCDFCEYHGFQYLVMCLLIPIIIALIWWWRNEIKGKINHIKQKIQNNNSDAQKQLSEFCKEVKKRIEEDAEAEDEQQDKKEYGWQYWE